MRFIWTEKLCKLPFHFIGWISWAHTTTTNSTAMLRSGEFLSTSQYVYINEILKSRRETFILHYHHHHHHHPIHCGLKLLKTECSNKRCSTYRILCFTTPMFSILIYSPSLVWSKLNKHLFCFVWYIMKFRTNRNNIDKCERQLIHWYWSVIYDYDTNQLKFMKFSSFSDLQLKFWYRIYFFSDTFGILWSLNADQITFFNCQPQKFVHCLRLMKRSRISSLKGNSNLNRISRI